MHELPTKAQDLQALPPDDIRPICVKILHEDDHRKDITSYDAELYTGNNDGNPDDYLTPIDVDNMDHITIHQLYTSVNFAQIYDSHQNIFPMKDLMSHKLNTQMLTIKMNLNQQMDSGANKNITNDQRIIRNCTNIPPIPIFGVGKNEAACHITEKGITTLTTIDGSELDVIMYFSVNCSGTIISPNAIVRDNHTFTSWTQTSHLDTGTAKIRFYHRTDFTQNKTIDRKSVV